MQPDRVLEFEPAQAKALEWLPLAVRYKLDGCGLKIRLEQWQALPLQARQAMVRCPAGAGFETLVLLAVPGARRLADGGSQPAFDDYVQAKVLQPDGAGRA